MDNSLKLKISIPQNFTFKSANTNMKLRSVFLKRKIKNMMKNLI